MNKNLLYKSDFFYYDEKIKKVVPFIITHDLKEMNFNEIISNNNLVLVDFYTEWCGPCKMLAPIIAEIKEELKDKVYVIKVNVDEEEDLSNKFGIYSIPTLVLIKGGKEIDRKVGYNTKQILIDWINRA